MRCLFFAAIIKFCAYVIQQFHMYNKQWYNTLEKSPLSPPNYVFGIVWPILYVMMFLSLYLVWTNQKCYPYCPPITLFIVHLALNMMWTTIFFKWQMPKLALLDLILILGLVGLSYTQFYQIQKVSAYLLIPYLLWLCFALHLNLYIVVYN